MRSRGEKKNKRKPALLLSLLLCLCVCLDGCGKGTEAPQSVLWHEQLSRCQELENYAVHLMTSRNGERGSLVAVTAEYDGKGIHLIEEAAGEDKREYYYVPRGDSCTVYIWIEKAATWVADETENNINYSEAYAVWERLEKLGYWIDQGFVTYDAEAACYSGKELSGSYAYDGKTHYVRSLLIAEKDGRVQSCREEYTVSPDDADVYTDALWMDSVGEVRLELPTDYMTREEAEEWLEENGLSADDFLS